MTDFKQTAILYFARTPGEEIKHKTFLGKNRRINHAIATQFYNRTLHQIALTGLPFFPYTEALQQGATFGERLANAFDDLYSRGYTNVIAVGSDSPGLEAAHILEAATALEYDNVVAGPTKQGGCYLMGLKKSAFDRSSFEKFDWQSDRLLRSVQNAFKLLLQLPFLSEINSEEHLRRFISAKYDLSKNLLSIIVLIKSWLSGQIFSARQHTRLLVTAPARHSFGRAP